jgi:hypothetical protein
MADAGKSDPWWHRAGLVTVLTAIVGAMVPLTAGVQAYVQNNRQIQLEREKHQQDIRLHYLDILVSSSLKDVEMFLTFIAQTDDSQDLKQWAQAQLGSVRGRIAGLESDLAASEKRAADAEKDLDTAKASAQQKLREAQADASASRAQKEKAEDAARKAQAALADAQRKVETRRAETMDRKDALGRRRAANLNVQQRIPLEANAAAD